MTSEAWQTEARRAKRREARAPSTLRAEGPQAIDVTVLDISETGFRITAESVELLPGQEVSIGLTGLGTRRGHVAWRRETEYGCAFEIPLLAEEANSAFAGASVVAIGPASPLLATAERAPDPLAGVYETHRVWALPLDAMIALAGFIALCGAGFWMLVRP